jgi:hypothetical protein
MPRHVKLYRGSPAAAAPVDQSAISPEVRQLCDSTASMLTRMRTERCVVVPGVAAIGVAMDMPCDDIAARIERFRRRFVLGVVRN